ncbi:MAG: DNA replication/repair protein RecF [Caldisericia bacterium]
MIIKKLKVVTFRNIEELEVNFIDKFNLIIGKNGSGKTNILNSIYYLATGSTIFSTKESELPKSGNTSFILEGLFNQNGEDIKIEIIFKDKRKIISINGKPISSLKELIGIVPIIYFNYRTKDLILREPEIRRDFLDSSISIMDKDYKKLIIEYQDLLTVKNSTLKKLKEERGNFYLETLLSTINEGMYEKGLLIQEKRDLFINKIREKIINFGFRDIKIDYEPKVITLQELNKIKQDEIERGFSLLGPHLDDIFFNRRGVDIKVLLSLGEIEELSLYIILSLWFIFYEKLKKEPIFLLDDLFETLDRYKIENLIDLLYNLKQVILTSFDEKVIPVELIKNSSTFFLEQNLKMY